MNLRMIEEEWAPAGEVYAGEWQTISKEPLDIAAWTRILAPTYFGAYAFCWILKAADMENFPLIVWQKPFEQRGSAWGIQVGK